jgi:hypothetical protein
MPLKASIRPLRHPPSIQSELLQLGITVTLMKLSCRIGLGSPLKRLMLLQMVSDLGYLRHSVEVVIVPTTELRLGSICSYIHSTLAPTPSLFIAENAWKSVRISSAACRKDMARALLPGGSELASAKQYIPCLSIKLIGWLLSYKHDLGTAPKRSSTVVILGGSLEMVGTEA